MSRRGAAARRSDLQIATASARGSDLPVAIWRSLLQGLALLGIVGLSVACEVQPDDRLERSRAIAAEFQQTLGGELKAAMAEGGPVQAIDVCAEVAPQIAARFSAESGAAVSRTAPRVRNPANAPDDDAKAVLDAFAERVAAGEPMPVEHFEAGPHGGMRYMSAIVLQPLCATCHGETLAPAVAEAVAEHYPDDRATGFQVGELRGAFLIDWPESGS